MPLTSKNDGPALQVGDIVKMEWVVTRVFPSRLNVVQVSRLGPAGDTATGPPASMAMRLGTRPSALETIPPGAPLAEGLAVLLLWRVTQVFPETGTVRVERDGLGGEPLALVPVTLSTGAAANELEYVQPAQTQARTILRPWSRALGRSAGSPQIEPDMLPYGFDPVNPLGTFEPVPVEVTALVPDTAQLGSPNFTLRVQGSGFDSTAVILWNGSPEPTTVVSDTEVTTEVNMATAQVALTLPVAVQTDTGISDSLPFTLTPAAAVLSVEEPAECAVP